MSDVDAVLHSVSHDDILAVAPALWADVRDHPADASCECPVFAVLGKLLELGYVITKRRSYFDIVREMTSDPDVLAALDRAEKEENMHAKDVAGT